MRCLLLLALTGCLIVPKRVDTTRQIGTYTATTPIPGRLGPVELTVTESYATVHVTATRAGHCRREVRGRFEHRHGWTPELVNLDEDDRRLDDQLALAILSMPLLAISGAITAGVTAVGHETIEHYEQTLDVDQSECPVLTAHVDLDVVVPSGATLTGTTNASGTFSIAIPASEPAQGIVIVRAPGVERALPYSRDRKVVFAPPSASVSEREPSEHPNASSPSSTTLSISEQRAALEQKGFTAVRDALRTCGESQDVHGLIAAQLAIDATGGVTSNPDRGGPAFASCVNGELADVRFPGEHAQKLVFPYRI